MGGNQGVLEEGGRRRGQYTAKCQIGINCVMGSEYLWPARNIAEFAYCPRLFYLMEVEGISMPSSDIIKGRLIHRRIDKPSINPDIETDNKVDGARPLTIRNLSLTSNSLKLTATLDLAEIKGKTAVPVEYRKGSPRRVSSSSTNRSGLMKDTAQVIGKPGELWPVDRVQIGLQTLLLKEAGYELRKGIIYYAAERYKLEFDIDEGILDEAMTIFEDAKICASGPRPLPLLNDPRCLRCSLEPFCLPDEINYSRGIQSSQKLMPRRIWPPRDDGIHVFIQSHGAKIGVHGESLLVTDKGSAVLDEMPLINIETVSLIGSVQISTQALHSLSAREIPIAFLSSAGRMICMVDPLNSTSASVRRAQVLKLENDKVKLELAKALINAKVANQRKLLMRNNKSTPKEISAELARLSKFVLDLSDIESVRGYEGQAANLYFGLFGGMINGQLGEQFTAHGRSRRPPPDPVNSCLSMAYTLLTNECVAALRLARLEPAIGALHVSRPGRPALALDLMEPFRPLISDSIVITAFNRKELRSEHFRHTSVGCMFTEQGRRVFFEIYGKRMNTQITHPIFGYRLSYRRMLVLHARMIAAWLLGEIENLSFLTTR